MDNNHDNNRSDQQQQQQQKFTPFGPAGGITVTLEDNTRTQFRPQVKILRRPRPNESTASNSSQTSSSHHEHSARLFAGHYDDRAYGTNNSFNNSHDPFTINGTRNKSNDCDINSIINNNQAVTAETDTGVKTSQMTKVKTYQERADEYAKARLRILGSASASCDIDTDDGVSTLESTTTASDRC